MARLRMAVIGVGHLGKEHARILAGLPEVELVGVADVNAEQALLVARRLDTRAYQDYRPLLDLVEAASIVVPTTQHFEVASVFLSRGLPVLVEKPLAGNLEQATGLVDLGRRHQTLLQVGHIERFNPAFEELQRRPLQPKFIDCARLCPFSGRSCDIGVVLDLMIHDLDLVLALVRSPVDTVEAMGVSVFGGHEDLAHARVRFANGCVANFTASRVHPSVLRRLQAWGPEGFASLDFGKRHLTLIQPSEQLRRWSSSPRSREAAALARLKEEWLSRYFQQLELDCSGGDQLTRELQHFVGCVQSGSRPRVGGEEAQAAMALAARILDALHGHCWQGQAGGASGPSHLPAPLGMLFRTSEGAAAA
jgi:predicted dehydrogenase